MWVATSDLPKSPGHPFYQRLNQVLDGERLRRVRRAACRRFYAPKLGRPSLPPGRYFRLMLLGYFEGLGSERGMAWRAADSLAIRSFLGLALEEARPDHSTISRTRRLIDVETHRAGVHVGAGAAGEGRSAGRARRSGSTRRRWRRTRRCGASCVGTRERATRSS